MIASIKYFFTGAEIDYLTDGDGNMLTDGDGNFISAGTTTVYFCATSGLKIIDVFFNGVSLDIGVDCTADEEYGKVILNEMAVRGDHAMVIYKTLPRYGTTTTTPPVAMVDFDSNDFDSNDFA